MFQNNYYNKKDIVVIPKNSLKHNFNVGVKPNVKKTYDNMRSIVEKDGGPSAQRGFASKEIDIKPIPNQDSKKKNYNNLKIILFKFSKL